MALGGGGLCGICVLVLGVADSLRQVALLWAAYSALGVLFNIGTSSLRLAFAFRFSALGRTQAPDSTSPAPVGQEPKTGGAAAYGRGDRCGRG